MCVHKQEKEEREREEGEREREEINARSGDGGERYCHWISDAGVKGQVNLGTSGMTLQRDDITYRSWKSESMCAEMLDRCCAVDRSTMNDVSDIDGSMLIKEQRWSSSSTLVIILPQNHGRDQRASFEPEFRQSIRIRLSRTYLIGTYSLREVPLRRNFVHEHETIVPIYAKVRRRHQ